MNTNSLPHTLLPREGRFPQSTDDAGPETATAGAASAPQPLQASDRRLREEAEKEGYRLLIAGGGTGGHLFPGIAIAEAFMAAHPGNSVLFVSTGNSFEKSILVEKDLLCRWISAEGFKGRGVWRKLRSLFKLPRGILQSMSIIKAFRPHLIMGMGGYSSGPVVIAAWLKGIPITLHEQNIIPGMTNRHLARLADRIYLSFPDTPVRAPQSRLRALGNPVRQAIIETALTAQGERDEETLFTILVLGGSQGAHSINMAMIEALSRLQDPGTYYFIHQTGAADEQLVKDSYTRIGLKADVKAFFYDIAPLYGQADLIICRSGATTVAEVTAIGRPTILVPYPYAADDHQALNALALADAGAAEVIMEKELDGPAIVERIHALRQDRSRLGHMADKSREIGNPRAAVDIIDDCYELIRDPMNDGSKEA